VVVVVEEEEGGGERRGIGRGVEGIRGKRGAFGGGHQV